MSVNKVILIGNLGKDPEVRHSQSGTAVCNLSIATTYKRKDQSGQQIEETEWHRVTMFNRLAEIAGEYLKKGASVYIEGRLQTRKWQGQDGQDRYTTEIIADQMQMLGGRGDGASGAQNQKHTPLPRDQAEQVAIRQHQQNYQADMSGMPAMDDDIPWAPLLARNAYVI